MPLWQLAAAALAVGLPRAEEHGLAPSRPKDEPRDLDRLANDLKILCVPGWSQPVRAFAVRALT